MSLPVLTFVSKIHDVHILDKNRHFSFESSLDEIENALNLLDKIDSVLKNDCSSPSRALETRSFMYQSFETKADENVLIIGSHGYIYTINRK